MFFGHFYSIPFCGCLFVGPFGFGLLFTYMNAPPRNSCTVQSVTIRNVSRKVQKHVIQESGLTILFIICQERTASRNGDLLSRLVRLDSGIGVSVVRNSFAVCPNAAPYRPYQAYQLHHCCTYSKSGFPIRNDQPNKVSENFSITAASGVRKTVLRPVTRKECAVCTEYVQFAISGGDAWLMLCRQFNGRRAAKCQSGHGGGKGV